ncbi:MAG: AlpA family transcriptional regulator [Vicinamibacterales bacterium]
MPRGLPPPSATRADDLLSSNEVIDRLLEEPRMRASALCVLPAIRTEGGWRFRRSDLEAWIAAARPRGGRTPS